MKKIYIVTGANGFLGNNVVRSLMKKTDAEVRALVSSLDHTEALNGLNCKIYAGDVTKLDSLAKIFDVPGGTEVFVIHCAGIVYIKSKPNPEVYRVNVSGTRNIVAKTLEVNGKMIYVSSTHAIPELPKGMTITEVDKFDPAKVEGEYAKSKADAGQYVLDAVRNRGLDACIVQPSGIIGPYDYKTSHLTQMMKDVMDGSLWAGVEGGYDFVDVRDVAEGILLACEKGEPGECYILSGHYVSVLELLHIVAEAAGREPITKTIPLWLAKVAAPLAEKYYEIKKQKPLFTKMSLDVLESNGKISHAKAERELGYHARSIKKTVADTVKWLKETH